MSGIYVKKENCDTCGKDTPHWVDNNNCSFCVTKQIIKEIKSATKEEKKQLKDHFDNLKKDSSWNLMLVEMDSDFENNFNSENKTEYLDYIEQLYEVLNRDSEEPEKPPRKPDSPKPKPDKPSPFVPPNDTPPENQFATNRCDACKKETIQNATSFECVDCFFAESLSDIKKGIKDDGIEESKKTWKETKEQLKQNAKQLKNSANPLEKRVASKIENFLSESDKLFVEAKQEQGGKNKNGNNGLIIGVLVSLVVVVVGIIAYLMYKNKSKE
jgi:tetrahydromethanopterin S-methyltransferase subunit F